MNSPAYIDALPMAEQVDELKERVRQLEAMLCFDVPPPFGLTRSEWKTVRPVLRDGRAPHARLMDELYWDRLDIPSQDIIKVFIAKARPKLSSHGIEIQNVWGWGYACDQATIPAWLRHRLRGIDAPKRGVS